MYLWLCWVFTAVGGLSLGWQVRAALELQCSAFSLRWPPLLQSTCTGHEGISSSARRPHSYGSQAWMPLACGPFLDQGSNSCPLHWQGNSNPQYHQGSSGAFSCPQVLKIYEVIFVLYFVYWWMFVCPLQYQSTLHGWLPTMVSLNLLLSPQL